MISPKDAEPVCAVWIEQFDRHHILPELYETLMNNAIDTRTKRLQEGENPPSLTVELLIAEFLRYKEIKMFGINIPAIDRLKSEIEFFKSRKSTDGAMSGFDRSYMQRTNSNSPDEALAKMEEELGALRSSINEKLKEAHLEQING
jgi:hypothetical protein